VSPSIPQVLEHVVYPQQVAPLSKPVDALGFCPTWHQEEFDHRDIHFREYEDYECTKVADNGRYCAGWKGKINSEEEFEFTECSCKAESEDGAFCFEWTCFEEGMDYFFPNLLWVLLGTVLKKTERSCVKTTRSSPRAPYPRFFSLQSSSSASPW